jgi:hypothetical protein
MTAAVFPATPYAAWLPLQAAQTVEALNARNSNPMATKDAFGDAAAGIDMVGRGICCLRWPFLHINTFKISPRRDRVV